ncbi:hypothetical protein A167_02338 [Alcanivorax sp. S71-1-4]|nr:hypothetical protein A167_02338 [Alcanivorax sp. S71-1-4]
MPYGNLGATEYHPGPLPMQTIYLVYDTECPACDQYCRLVRIRESAGELVLVDARAPGPLMDEITAAGLDIDQGMVLKLDHQLYYGADAIHMLALLGSPSGLFNRFNRRLFGSRHLSRVLYPLLRACRNLLLKILRKTRINNLDLKERERF